MDTAVLRRYHVSITIDALEAQPTLLHTFRSVGITDVWLLGFLYGYWFYTVERLQHWRERISAYGLVAHVINVPFGHPGDSLGCTESFSLPLCPPPHWGKGTLASGEQHTGTMVSAVALQENVAALGVVAEAGFDRVFLDDDFRCAPGPGIIGGNFDAVEVQKFCARYQYSEQIMQTLRADIRARRLTPVVADWLTWTDDQLRQAFQTMREAVPQVDLGIMVMYLGAEKAGIRLADYAGVPLRVGELMFNDQTFSPTKGKTDELFSVLFHRRTVAPELAYSETTAFPAEHLSAHNMAAKLVISTIADVRNTMFMSGIQAIPITHWPILAPAMKEQRAVQQRIAGHQLCGPIKLYWGKASRYIGQDLPYSLPLALGIPFAFTDEIAQEGWTFLADDDANAIDAGTELSAGTTLIRRQATDGKMMAVDETLDALFAWKQAQVSQLGDVPYVQDPIPTVCAWYPTAGLVLLWNLTEETTEVTLRWRTRSYRCCLPPLGTLLVEE